MEVGGTCKRMEEMMSALGEGETCSGTLVEVANARVVVEIYSSMEVVVSVPVAGETCNSKAAVMGISLEGVVTCSGK